MTTDSIIVAIELGSSKIAGIAGKRKDGTMQILAYAEEKSNGCIKRGVVYNIEKTTSSVRNIISKLETTLGKKISKVYVGIGGQSVRSMKTSVKRNLITPTCINANQIDSITDESRDIPFPDCVLIDNFAQEYVIDANTVVDPVGVMGTNIEGEFLNVIAKAKLKNNIENGFNNTELHIIDYKLAAYELANNVLSDTEKRSGCALIDFGAATTTVAVFKNNIVRHLVTIPLGSGNINLDISSSYQVDESEAETLKLKYANAYDSESANANDNPIEKFTTSDGRTFDVPELQMIINARLNEIITNVQYQIKKSGYTGQLLGGIILTGGGSNMKNVEKAFVNVLNIEKVRTAKRVTLQLIKNSTISNLNIESPTTTTILSLLLSGDEDCVGELYNGPDIFDNKKREEDIEKVKAAAQAEKEKEEKAFEIVDGVKNDIRTKISAIQAKIAAVEEDGANKQLRDSARTLIDSANEQFDPDFDQSIKILVKKDKYKQAVKEADDLIKKLDAECLKLEEACKKAEKDNSLFRRIGRYFSDTINGGE